MQKAFGATWILGVPTLGTSGLRGRCPTTLAVASPSVQCVFERRGRRDGEEGSRDVLSPTTREFRRARRRAEESADAGREERRAR